MHSIATTWLRAVRSLVVVAPLALVLAAVGTGCGGANSAGGVRLRSGSTALFGEHSARLSAATAALEQAVGHPVDIEIDAALASGHESWFGERVAREIESLARYLAVRRRPRDMVFAGVLADFVHLAVSYEPLKSSRQFEPVRRLLSLRIGVGESWDAEEPIRRETSRRFEARYGRMAPDRVPADEIELFAWWLAGEAVDDNPTRAVRAIVPLIAVESRLGPQARREARLGLLRGMAKLRVRTPYRAAASVDDATTRAFADWAGAGLARFDPSELAPLMSSVAAEPFLPGLDPVRLIDVAGDVWTQAGRPVFPFLESEEVLAKYPPLVQRVLVPGTVSSGSALYAAVAARADSMEALSRRLAERGDPILRDVVSLHLFEETCSRGEREACQRVEASVCRPGPKAKEPGAHPEIARRLSGFCEGVVRR